MLLKNPKKHLWIVILTQIPPWDFFISQNKEARSDVAE